MSEPDAITDRLSAAPIVPLVQDDDPARAVATARALGEGGLGVIEVLLRGPGAMRTLEAVRGDTEGLIVGAGTVLSREQAIEAVGHGAQFIVSPGLSEDIVRFCGDEGLPCFPGTSSATEVQRAHELGLACVKFFPAKLSGGAAMLKALGAVFGAMRFMPTGGIGPGELGDYLALPQVLACGGSWLTPEDAIANGDFATVTRLAGEALQIAGRVRG